MKYNFCWLLIISLFSLGVIVAIKIQERLVPVLPDKAIDLVVRLDRTLTDSAESCSGSGQKIREPSVQATIP